jgi:hypothetical protein
MNIYYSSRSSRPGAGFLVRSPRRISRDRGIKKRPAHHLAGAHKHSALYSSRRAPYEKPTEKVRLGAPGVGG